MKSTAKTLSKELSKIESCFVIGLIFLLSGCFPPVEKDLSKRINTASSDVIFEHYLNLGEAIAANDSVDIKEYSDKLIYVSSEFYKEDLISRIEQILKQEKSHQEKYFSLTLQIQKILENSQGLHFHVDTNYTDSNQKFWFSFSSKNKETPY